MVMCCTAASEPGPRNWISPMWLTSNKPTPVRTAMCSAMRPPPGPGYSTGMSQPPKSTILALRARWVALRAVFFNAGATVTSEVVIAEFLSQPMLYPTNDRDWAVSGSNPTARIDFALAQIHSVVHGREPRAPRRGHSACGYAATRSGSVAGGDDRGGFSLGYLRRCTGATLGNRNRCPARR